MVLQVRRLSKEYGRVWALRDVDLDVDRGDVLAVIGPTGAGKTTLLRLIDLLERPTSGAMYFDGVDANASERVRLGMRRMMATVTQRPTLFHATVYDNVAYGLRIRKEHGLTQRSKVTAALEAVGLSGYEDRNARTLSGGETQRVALARAMALQPSLLLLDEPTANLDTIATARVEQLIADISLEMDTTIVMATHDMAQAYRLAARMVVLIGGQVLQAGEPRDVFSRPESTEVAALVGVANILPGAVTFSEAGVIAVDVQGAVVEAIADLPVGTLVSACIRPEEVTLAVARTPTSARNCFLGQVSRVITQGPLVRVELDCGFPLVAAITQRSVDDLNVERGKQMYVSFKATGVHVIAKRTGEAGL